MACFPKPEMLLHHRAPGMTVAVLLDHHEQATDVLLDLDHRLPAGARCVGHAGAVLPGGALQAVSLPTGETGMLPLGKNKALPEGTAVAALVQRAALPGKGPKLKTCDEAPPSKPARPDVQGWARARGWEDDAKAVPLAALIPFVEDVCQTTLPLPGGGRALLAATPAAVTVDLDQGSARGPDRNAWARAVVRALRAGGHAGVIFIDPPGGTQRGAKRGQPWASALRDALTNDPDEGRVTGVTPSGLVEVVRRRTGPPVAALWQDEAVRVLCALDALDPAQAVLDGWDIPALWYGLLQGSLAPALAEAGQRFGGPIRLRVAAEASTSAP